jgi:hypothetical protein
MIAIAVPFKIAPPRAVGALFSKSYGLAPENLTTLAIFLFLPPQAFRIGRRVRKRDIA